MTFPLDFYAARAAVSAALSAYPVARDADLGLTADQRKKRRGTNFMTNERLSNRNVGPFMVEISTGVFLQSRMIGITPFRIGGERDGDSDLCSCVHSVDEMTAHLAKLAEA